MTILQKRGGLPRLGARLRAKETARIVAFGSSITHDAYYLEPLVPRLRGEFPGADVDVLVRSLPGFMSFWAVHRTQSIAELDPDLVIVEFAVNDHGLQVPELTLKSIEGIVRRLRASAAPPDIVFVYFMSRLVEALPRQAAVIELWERVAAHYGVPSIDCSALAEHFVQTGQAIWLDRWPGRPAWETRNHPVALTRDLSHHTFEGGRLLGEEMAQAIAAAAADGSAQRNGMPAPLHADHFAEAKVYFPADLCTHGWTRKRVDDSTQTQLTVMYFSEILVPERAGATLEFTFEGRTLAIWGYSSPNNVITLDGNQASLNLPDSRMAFPTFIVRQDVPSTHRIRIEVREFPFELGALDVMGSLRL
ncbi:MAG: SGNH/GDSL hydrolase family protein [Vulcanimicrobiaceae bacterium]